MSNGSIDHTTALRAITRHQDLTRLKTERGAVGLERDILRYEGTVVTLASKYDVPYSANDIISQGGKPLLDAISLN